MKKFLKENIVQILILIVFTIVINYELPYYIEAPGGVINITERMNNKYDKKNGSLNMLYVTQYKGNVVTVLLSKVIKSWDLNKIEKQQISDEDSNDIYLRNRVMLDNSIQNAIFAAYTEAGKEIKVTGRDNYVLAVTKDNGFKIGDKVLKVNDVVVKDINTLKEILENKNVGDEINILVNRNNKDIVLKMNVPEDRILGVMIITNYKYDVPDDVSSTFKSGEGGASGGFVLSMALYSKITGTDLLRGRNIAGTGTIDILGNVGEIDGIKYKIAGAVKNKIDLVLVSPDNYDEAINVVKDNNYKIDIVKVATLKDAIEYLTQ